MHLWPKQATAGLAADGRHLASRARDEANSYREQYRSPAPVKVRTVLLTHLNETEIFRHKQTISERLGLYCQAYTLYSSVRPFGISAILGGIDKAFGPSLFCIEPSGVFWVRFEPFIECTTISSYAYALGLPRLCCRERSTTGQDRDREIGSGKYDVSRSSG